MFAGIDIKESTLLIIDEPFNTLDNDGLLSLLNIFSRNMFQRRCCCTFYPHINKRNLSIVDNTAFFEELEIRSLEICPHDPCDWKLSKRF